MIAEAAAIADMERRALQMSAKRAELEAEVLNRLQLEDTLKQEAQQMSQKREAMEAKMRQEEAELQKLSDEAKRRVLDKMAAEAAAIADMEKEASELAAEREALASQIANQRASAVIEDVYPEGGTISMNAFDGRATQPSPIGTVNHNGANEDYKLGRCESGVAHTPSGGADDEEAPVELKQRAANPAHHGQRTHRGVSRLADHGVTFAANTPHVNRILPNECVILVSQMPACQISKVTQRKTARGRRRTLTQPSASFPTCVPNAAHTSGICLRRIWPPPPDT